MIVPDTHVLSGMLRQKPGAYVLNSLDLQEPATLHLTSVTLAEMAFGVREMPEPT